MRFPLCCELFNCRCQFCRFPPPPPAIIDHCGYVYTFSPLPLLHCSPLLKYFSSQKIESFSLFIFFTLYQTLKIRCELRRDYKCDKKKWMEVKKSVLEEAEEERKKWRRKLTIFNFQRRSFFGALGGGWGLVDVGVLHFFYGSLIAKNRIVKKILLCVSVYHMLPSSKGRL